MKKPDARPPHCSHVDAWVLHRIRPSLPPDPAAAVRAAVFVRSAQYLRVSTPRQSIDLQRRQIARFAASNGLTIVASYEDRGRSGLTLEGRSGLTALLSDIVSGQAGFTQLIIVDISRWGRFQDPDEAAHYEFVCRAHGVNVTYCHEPLLTGASGHLVKQVKRVMAADYARQVSERTRSGKRRAAKAGLAPGNWPRSIVARQIIEADGQPGPVLREGEFRHHPTQAMRLVPAAPAQSLVVRSIFQLFTAGGLTLREIAERLSASGVAWSDGTPWTRRRVARILRNPLAIGRQSYGLTRMVLGVKTPGGDPFDRGQVQVFDPIVPVAMFEAAQARFRTLGGRTRHTDEEMICGLRTLLMEKGELSASLINACAGIPASRLYEVRFGSLGAAWRKVGYEPPVLARGVTGTGERPTREEILDGLRRLWREQGRINVRLVDADRRLPSRHIIRTAFGSLTAAYRAAGL